MTLIRVRRDTAADWAAANPILQLGEPGYDTTNLIFKLGDGVTAWASLPPIGNTADHTIDPTAAPWNADNTGVTDATAAVRAAADYANSFARQGLTASIFHPGAKLVLNGTFNLSTLAAPIEFRCDVENNGAVFIVPAAYADTAVLAGHSTSGVTFQCATMQFPDVVKPTGSAQVASSEAIRFQNIFNSDLILARWAYFDTGLRFTGDNSGAAYNRVFVGWGSYCKKSIVLKPHTAGGYANQNTFVGGGLQQSIGYAGGNKVSGWRHVVLDGNSISNVTGNVFENVSFEGDVSEYVFEFAGAYDNTFYSCRHEQGVNGIACTFTGGGSSTITKVAHGLSVGNMVTFSATVAPTSLALVVPYFVTSTPTADTFTVSSQRGGTSITFASTGTAVTYFVPQRILIDSTSQNVSTNTFVLPMTPVRAIDLIIQGTNNTNNTVQWSDRQTMSVFADTDRPPIRARNTSGTATSRPLYAAYAPTTNPDDDPNNWTTATSDRGLLFAESRAEIGRVYGSAGIIQYRRPADTVPYEIASCRRSPSLITSISGLSVPANGTTSATFTLTGAATNDHIVVTPVAGMVANVIVSHAYCNTADTITITFGNLTAAPIVISPTLQAMAVRRFF